MRLKTTELLSILLILFVLFNIALLIKIVGASEESVSFKELSPEKESLLISIIYQQMESEYTKINGSVILDTEDGNTLSLEDLVSDKPLVLLHYSELHCNLCIDHNLEYIKILADSLGDENVAIIAEYKNSRDLMLFRRINQISMPIYRLHGEGLGLPIEKYMVPYLFITDNTLVARHIHIPNKDIPMLNNVFISTILKHYSRLTDLE